MNTNMTFLLHLLLIIFIGWATFPESPSAFAQSKEPAIKILTPHNGQIVKPTFEVLYQLQTGLSKESVDVFLDGFYQRDFTNTFTNVPIGKHEILVKVSTDGPEPIIALDHIEIEVK